MNVWSGAALFRARKKDILCLIGKEAATHVLLGTTLGLCGALLSKRLIASMLAGVAPSWAPMLIGVAFVLSLSAIIACYVAVRKAMRVQPGVAIRHE